MGLTVIKKAKSHDQGTNANKMVVSVRDSPDSHIVSHVAGGFIFLSYGGASGLRRSRQPIWKIDLCDHPVKPLKRPWLL